MCRNVDKHIAEMENAISDSEEEPNEIHVNVPCSDDPILSDDSEISSTDNTYFGFVENEPYQSDSVSHENTSDIDIKIECNASYYLLSDSEEKSSIVDIDSNNENDRIREKLADWAVECDVPMVTFPKLLCILRDYMKDLPKDPRTLLGTKV